MQRLLNAARIKVFISQNYSMICSMIKVFLYYQGFFLSYFRKLQKMLEIEILRGWEFEIWLRNKGVTFLYFVEARIIIMIIFPVLQSIEQSCMCLYLVDATFRQFQFIVQSNIFILGHKLLFLSSFSLKKNKTDDAVFF